MATKPTKATVTWKPPLSNGGDPIIGYSVTCTSVPGGVKVGPKIYTGASTTTTGVSGFTGLTPLTQYTCAVVAFNNYGPGTPGVSKEFGTVPTPRPPAPPASLYIATDIACNGDCSTILVASGSLGGHIYVSVASNKFKHALRVVPCPKAASHVYFSVLAQQVHG